MNIVFHVPELSRSIPCLNNVKNYLKLSLQPENEAIRIVFNAEAIKSLISQEESSLRWLSLCEEYPYRGQFGDRKLLYYKGFPGMSTPVFMVSVCSSVKIKGRDCGTINGHDESSSIRTLMKDAREVLVR